MRHITPALFGLAVLPLLVAVAMPAAADDPPGVTPPKMLKEPHPRVLANCYPPVSRQAGAEGRVIIQVTVTEGGRLTDVEVPPGSEPWLLEAAECIVTKLSFAPAMMGDQPVRSRVRIPINLAMENYDGSSPAMTHARVISSREELIEIYRQCYPAGSTAVAEISYTATIGRKGSVMEPAVVDAGADPVLVEAGLCILRKMRFEPSRRDGKPLTSKIAFPIVVGPPPAR